MQCGEHCSGESYGVTITQDREKIIFPSLKFSFFTCENRIVGMCRIHSCGAGWWNKKRPAWAPGA